MTQEELLGSALVLRRPGRIGWHTGVAVVLALLAWYVTIKLTAVGLSDSADRWWLLLAFAFGVTSLLLSVLAVRAATSRVEMTSERISVTSFSGRRSAPWVDVVAVTTSRPYLGVLGAMPVLKLRGDGAVAVDSLAMRLPPGTEHPDRDRIARYLRAQAIPALPPRTVVAQPTGPARGGELIIRVGRLGTAPNRTLPALRVVAVRVGRPVLTLGTFVFALVTIGQVSGSHWLGAVAGLALTLGCALVLVIIALGLARPSILTSEEYRSLSAIGETFAWRPYLVDLAEDVNAWGTRYVGHLVVTKQFGEDPVHLWETSRLASEAAALQRVTDTY